MPGDELTQKEKRETLRNDQAVREQQAATLHGFAISEASEVGGRFRSVSAANVVGATPTLPPVPAPNWAHDPSGQEPPLGVAIDALEPVGNPQEIARSLAGLNDNSELGPVPPLTAQDTGGPDAASSTTGVKRAGSLSLQGGDDDAA